MDSDNDNNSSNSNLYNAFWKTFLEGTPGPIYVLKRIDNNGNAYPFALQARSQAEFTTADFDTVWNILIANPDRAFKL